DWYRKAAKKKLDELRRTIPAAKLADAQLAIAREHGFSSWRALNKHMSSASAHVPAFFDAIVAGDRARVEQMLDQHPQLTLLKNDHGSTALHVAAENDDRAITRILLERGAKVDDRFGDSGHSALSWALTVRSFHAADAMVRGGVEPDLFCAAGLGDVIRIRSFFDESGHLKDKASKTGSSRFGSDGNRIPIPPATKREMISDALYLASRNGMVEAVRELLTHDPDVMFPAFLGASPLHWSYFGYEPRVAALLIAAGANPAARDPIYRCTPKAFGICVAASWGIQHLIEKQLDADPSLANIAQGRGTPLHEAARAGQVRAVQLLLQRGANRDARDADGLTPLNLAQREKHNAVIAILQASPSS
ncbi:MAG: ankyrin repeat domain-containing protein, partial [Anaerolineae bacterium]|nr:ankyrin repeat domain-containing protein [Phycisphaerae bacterium]